MAERPTDVFRIRGTLTLMTPENLKLYNVRVKPSVWEDARKIAEAQGDRISDVIRTLIGEYVRKNRRVLEQREDAE